MKILQGQDLVNKLRELADNISFRLWIAVPYIGGPTSLRKILGKQWFNDPKVSVKLLTDTSDVKNINSETVKFFYERGTVKTLTGLHGKIYIIDDWCLVTSANLTNTAFSKRHEIGILFQKEDAKKIIKAFDNWWQTSENIKPEVLSKVISKNHESKEEVGINLPTLWALPDDPGAFIKNPAKKFLNYDRLLEDYKDFATKYSLIQRIWPNKPLFFEIDGLFNYLYHYAPKTPSKKYSKENPRKLTEEKQIREIEKWALRYNEWNTKISLGEWRKEDITWRVKSSRTIRGFLSPSKIATLSRENIEEIFNCLNSLNSYPINKTKILNNNSISDISNALNQLVNGHEQLAARMDFCNKIKSLGPSSMNEIIGFAYPRKYPLINKNSNSGLRFFGYQIKAYN